MKRTILLHFAALAGLALATACGSDGRPPTAPAPAPAPIVTPPTPPTPPTPAVPPTLTVTRILAFGDSMTEGVDSPPLGLAALDWKLPLSAGRTQSYPYKLKSLIEARYTDQKVDVFNGGLGGRQAREDLERFDSAMDDSRPDLLLLLQGVNDLNQDLLTGEGDNARIRSVVDALEVFVKEAQFFGTHVMIATLPPQRRGGPKAWSAHLISDFNAALRSMAQKKGAQVVELESLPLSMIGQDGLHPTEAGYQRIAEIWFDAIKQRFEKPAASTMR